LNPTTVRTINPKFVQTHAGWLAVSEAGSPLGIGVLGATKREADQRFAKELEAWATLCEKPAREEATK
jgi:hypothetical protein